MYFQRWTEATLTSCWRHDCQRGNEPSCKKLLRISGPLQYNLWIIVVFVLHPHDIHMLSFQNLVFAQTVRIVFNVSQISCELPLNSLRVSTQDYYSLMGYPVQSCEDRKLCPRWLLQVHILAHNRPAAQLLFVRKRWCLCLLPFIIFPERPAHTQPIVCWYDLSNADPSERHTHRSTVCHCITRHSLGHTVHIYSFITMRHFV